MSESTSEYMGMKYQSAFFLGAVLLLAFGLRFYNLADNPAGFFRDEADKGYTTWSLIQTGCDQTGKHWPLFVRSLNVTTSALYQYLDIPFIAALGLTELAVRLPACLAGSLSVLAVYLLARAWWGRKYALWAALFVCLSPWSLLLSRWANQSSLLMLSMPLGVYFFARGKESFPPLRDALFSSFCFLVAFYTYEPAQLVVPLLMIGLWLAMSIAAWRTVETRAKYFTSLLAFFVLFSLGSLPMLYHILYETAESTARLSRISIFDGQPLPMATLEFLRNYLLHFSPDFLFLNGDSNPRHNTLLFGQVHLYLAPLILAGVVHSVIQRSKVDRVLLLWLLVFPVAAACTRESIPHALRSVFGVPVLELLAARGLVALEDWRSRWQPLVSPETARALRLGWIAAIVLLSSLHVYDLHWRYPIYSADYWEYGYKEAIGWWQEHRGEADHTVVSGLAEYPHIFFLFYDRYPPRQWIETHTMEGVEFLPVGQSADAHLRSDQGRVLYLVRPEELAQVQAEKVIRTPAGQGIWKWCAWGQK